MTKVPAIMFQGTSSSAGKSVLTAALCRLLARKCLNVAPFKAQNMSLNSHVTAAGEEVGRAQALQAQACDLETDARMNPVLLKPIGQGRSQVIVMGKPIGTMTWQEYVQRKRAIWRTVAHAYDSLAQGRDIMVLEGAGSPAEINLRRHDIVNMRMAAHAAAKVTLVADIDRGGAFAAIAGTMALLSRGDRRLVSGYILNRFRGDKSLLTPALDVVCKKTGRPFFGIMPMLADLRLPDEDSQNLADRYEKGVSKAGKLDIALVNLPQISNYTDFDPLARENCVHLRLIDHGVELGKPDLIILPGSRNVPASMEFLHASGLHDAILAYGHDILRGERGNIAGICAGLQLLGIAISDPYGIEGGGSVRGLGLLPISTCLLPQKTLAKVEGMACSGLCGREFPVSGYEIHHGRVFYSADVEIAIRNRSGEALGWGTDKGNGLKIWATSLHGVFDDDNFRHAYLEKLARERAIEISPALAFDVDAELDRLAEAMAANVDIRAMLSPLGISL